MFDKIKAQATRAKEFVQTHPTPVAVVVTSAITGGVTWKLTRDIAVRGFVAEATGVAYEWGYRMGELETEQLLAWNFLKEKGLLDEFTTNVLGRANGG